MKIIDHAREKIARLVHPRRRNQKGQALVEFAMVMPILVVLCITTLSFVPLINASGATLSAGATALSRATSYVGVQGEKSWTGICAVTYAAAYGQISGSKTADGAPELDMKGIPATGGCTSGANPSGNSARLQIDVFPVDARGNKLSRGSYPPAPGQAIEVCVGYRYQPTGGIWWFLTNGPGISRVTTQYLVFRYCGIDTIETYRSQGQ
jgi:hypothetical protein